MNAEKRYYIIESYQSEQSSLECTTPAGDFIYCVTAVTPQGAEIIDFGYPMLTEVLVA